MPNPKFFCFYESYGACLEILTDAQAGRLIKAMYAQFFGGEVPELKGLESVGFSMISFQLESDRKKYQKVCERNRKNIQSRWHKEDTSGNESNEVEDDEYEDDASESPS